MSAKPMQNRLIDLSVNKVIPLTLAITDAGTDLYSIGLSNHKPFNAPKRRWFHKPIVVFAVIFSQFILRQLVSLLLPQQNEWFYAIIGDVTYFLGTVWVHTSIAIIVAAVIALSSQLLNYY